MTNLSSVEFMEIFPAVIVIAVIALAVLFYKRASRAKAVLTGSTDAFADFAAQNGWQIIPIKSYILTTEIGERLGCDAGNYSLFKYGTTQTTTRAAVKREGDKTYFIFDMHYSWGGGNVPADGRDLTALALCAPNLSLPKFALYPREDRVFHAAVRDVHYPGSDIVEFLGNRGIYPFNDYEEPWSFHPPDSDTKAFNEIYLLRGKETDAIKRIFDDETLSALERLAPTCVDGQGCCLFAFNAAQIVPPEQYQAFVAEKMSVLDVLIRASAR